MTPAFRHVFFKEVVDNFRDRRTMFSAILGPLFGPVLFVAVMTMSLSRAISSSDVALELPTVNLNAAPALVDFLAEENVIAEAGPVDRAAAIAAVESGAEDLVLVLPEAFSEHLRSGIPARIELIVDESNSQASPKASRVRRLANAWGDYVGSLRLRLRGVDPGVTDALRVDVIDTSTPSGRSAIILGMLTYFMLFSMLMGGMYLAIDSTAGERERGSLEPLLSLPVSRGELILGKIAATCVYMLLSLIIVLIAFAVAIQFLPLERIGMTANFGPVVVLKAFLILAPFALLGASLMTVVASFTKSYKEAQTYMTFVMLLPTIPIIIAAVLTLRPNFELMAVPSLSQHLLVTELIKNEALIPSYVWLSESTTILLGIFLAWLATRLYRREGLLV